MIYSSLEYIAYNTLRLLLLYKYNIIYLYINYTITILQLYIKVVYVMTIPYF